MTLDEAIEEQELLATSYTTVHPNYDAAQRHREVAEFLRELRIARKKIDLLISLRDGFKNDALEYKAENDELKRQLRDAYEIIEQMRVHCVLRMEE